MSATPSVASAGRSETDESVALTPEPEDLLGHDSMVRAEDAMTNTVARSMEVVKPTNIEELQKAVRDADKVRIHSSHRSFATTADTDGVQVHYFL